MIKYLFKIVSGRAHDTIVKPYLIDSSFSYPEQSITKLLNKTFNGKISINVLNNDKPVKFPSNAYGIYGKLEVLHRAYESDFDDVTIDKFVLTKSDNKEVIDLHQKCMNCEGKLLYITIS